MLDDSSGLLIFLTKNATTKHEKIKNCDLLRYLAGTVSIYWLKIPKSLIAPTLFPVEHIQSINVLKYLVTFT